MRPKILLVGMSCLLFTFLVSTKVFAGQPAGSFKLDVNTQKFVLDNGLTVLITDMPNSSTVAVYALAKTGSAMEGKYLGSGISHFLEHMLFKGTDKRPVGTIAREVQAMGGTINASTSFDYTIYVIDAPEGNFDHALDIISDMIVHSKFDPEEIKKEREVVFSEIRLYKDRPERRLSDEVSRLSYARHPYRVPIIGYEELLRPLTREDFVEYYKERYAPNNIILSVAGKLDPQETLLKIKEAFKDFSRQREVLRNLPAEPPQVGGRQYEFEYPTQLARMTFAYGGVSVSHPDVFALDVLALILGQGESSRLYQDLFQKNQLVRAVSASNFTPMDRGVFEIDCTLDEKNKPTVIAAVKNNIQKIIAEGIRPAELEKAQRQILARYVFDHQTPGNIAYNTAIDESFVGDYRFSQKYIDEIQKVKAADIARVARQYLVDTNLSLVILNPAKEKSPESAQVDKNKETPIKEVNLPNGMRILLRENKALPLVSAALVVSGGTMEENLPINGVAKLTANLWVNGSKSLSGDKLTETLDARGISLGGFSGRNSFGFTVNALSSELDFVIDLIANLIEEPVFDAQQLERERQQLQTAIISKKDSISQLSTQKLKETLFKTHPFRRDELGSLDSVKQITRQDVLDYYGRLVKPGNMVLSVFGNFDSEKLAAVLTKRFFRLTASPVKLAGYKEAAPDKTREETLRLDKEQAMVVIGFRGPDMYSPERYGVEVLSGILGSSFSGRIFTRIRDEFGKAYTLGGSFIPSRDVGMIYFYVQTTADNAAKVQELLRGMFQELQTKPVSAQELADIKAYLKGGLHMGIETDAELAFLAALDELYGLGYAHYKDYDKLIDQVTVEQVQALAKKYLNIENAAIVMTLPSEKKSVEGTTP